MPQPTLRRQYHLCRRDAKALKGSSAQKFRAWTWVPAPRAEARLALLDRCWPATPGVLGRNLPTAPDPRRIALAPAPDCRSTRVTFIPCPANLTETDRSGAGGANRHGA